MSMSLEKCCEISQSSLSEISNFFRHRAWKNLFTLQQLIEAKNQMLHTDAAKNYPRWLVSTLDGYWRAFDNMNEFRCLFYTHCLDGKRFRQGDVYVEGREFELNIQSPQRSCWAYFVSVGDENIFVPYRNQDREQDLETGVLKYSVNDLLSMKLVYHFRSDGMKVQAEY